MSSDTDSCVGATAAAAVAVAAPASAPSTSELGSASLPDQCPNTVDAMSNKSSFASSAYSTTGAHHHQHAPCRYYLRGICKFGEACRYLHIPMQLAPIDFDPVYAAVDLVVPSGSTTDVTDNNRQTSTADMQSIGGSNKYKTPATGTGCGTGTSWADAPEFVPRNLAATTTTIDIPLPQCQKSYAQILGCHSSAPVVYRTAAYNMALGGGMVKINNANTPMCPAIMDRSQAVCLHAEICPFRHGDLCDLCNRFCLHPTSNEMRQTHLNECLRQREKEIEHSRGIARSIDKACGICFEVVIEKSKREQKFGILPNCNHIFCLECIRKWRQSKQFENKIIRACPECRITSDFVCPSKYWVETKVEKDKLISAYREALGEKNCKYFKQGLDRCPFGNKCFYKHCLPNGMRVDVGVPRRRQNHAGEVNVMQELFLWDYLDDRDQQWLDDLASFLSESSESDWSEQNSFDDIL